MRLPDQTTIVALQDARSKLRSLEAVRVFYGIKVSRGTLSRILRGKGISYQAENQVRYALHLACLLVEVDPCPDCGMVHALRCNGKANPVFLVRSGKPRKRSVRGIGGLDPELLDRLRDNKDGMTWTSYLDMLLYYAEKYKNFFERETY